MAVGFAIGIATAVDGREEGNPGAKAKGKIKGLGP
jgi:hypothetical protein